MAIPFTQYMRPNGRQVPVTVDRPEEIENLARAVVDAGGRFEVEHLVTGHASITCAFKEQDIACEVVPNGPEVPPAVDKVVQNAYRQIVTEA